MIVGRDVGTASWTGRRALRRLARDCIEGTERAGVADAGRRFSLVYGSVIVEVQPAHEGVGGSGQKKPGADKEQYPH